MENSSEKHVSPDLLELALREVQALGGLRAFIRTLERDMISKTLWDNEGVKARAASDLGMNRTTLVMKIGTFSTCP